MPESGITKEIVGMKKMFLLSIVILFSLPFTLVWGQSEIENISSGTLQLVPDSVKLDSAVSPAGLPVSDCVQRARLIKEAIASRSVKKVTVDDKHLDQRVEVLEVKCDSLDSKVTGISDKLAAETKQDSGFYVVQVCVLTNPLLDPSLGGKQLVMDRVKRYYRYCLKYDTLEEAEAALPGIQKFFPDAFIRKIE